jgi:ubiquinone biosynthesis protein COQ9
VSDRWTRIVMARRPDPTDRIIAAALRLAAEKGWGPVGLADIAAEAGLGLAELYDEFRSKPAILAALHRRIDRAALAGDGTTKGGAAAAADERPRDRLFDVVMRRFDALQPYKPGIRAIARDTGGDPIALLCGAAALLNSMRWMLEASGVPAHGWRGTLRSKLLLGIYLSVLRVWLSDETPDMARTMAALDRRLRQVERWLSPAAPGSPEGDAAAPAPG